MHVCRGILLMAGLALLAAVAAGPARAAPPQTPGTDETGEADMADVYKTVAIAASVSFLTAVSIVGAGFAVGKVGAAAIGAAAEKPELLTRSLLFVALAEGLAVLGVAVAMVLLGKM
ncbi:MAG: ATP synthase subunit C [Phycisphaerae bacterium]